MIIKERARVGMGKDMGSLLGRQHPTPTTTQVGARPASTPPKRDETPFLSLLNTVQKGLYLTDEELAPILEVQPGTLRKWRVGMLGQRKHADVLLRLHLLLKELGDTFTKPEAIGNWMHNPVRYLGNRTPIAALQIQCFDSVDSALIALQEGVYI